MANQGNQPLSQLPEATSVENDDILYSVVDGVSKKVTKGTLFDGVTFGEEVTTVEAEAISPYLHESDIVDGLNSTSITDVLSANQGRVLNSAITELDSRVDEAEEDISTLNTNLVQFNRLGVFSSITNVATSFELNESFNNYYFILLQVLQYNNSVYSLLVSTDYFNNTSASIRPILFEPINSNRIDVYKNDDTHIYIKANTTLDTYFKVDVFGFMRKTAE